MSDILVFTRFMFMSLAYFSFEDPKGPAVREYAIFNDGVVKIRESGSGSDDWDSEETLHVFRRFRMEARPGIMGI